MEINVIHAIYSLGDWKVAIWDNDLSTIKFYSGADEISKPSNFPSDANINARKADMQTKADTGNYDSIQAIIATY